MTVLLVAYLAALALMAAAGAAKLGYPDGLAGALRTAGLSTPGWVVRLAAAGEVTLAVVALTVPGRLPAALVACSYVAFAGFVVSTRTRGLPISDCGCFGRVAVRPGPAHALVNLAGAAAAASWAASETVAPVDRLVASAPPVATAVVVAGLGSALLAGWALRVPARRSARSARSAWSGRRHPVVPTAGGPVDEAGGRHR